MSTLLEIPGNYSHTINHKLPHRSPLYLQSNGWKCSEDVHQGNSVAKGGAAMAGVVRNHYIGISTSVCVACACWGGEGGRGGGGWEAQVTR